MFLMPASSVAVAPDGALYAFQLGKGVLRSPAGRLRFESLGNVFGAQVPLRLAFGPGERLYAGTNAGRVFVSDDGGRSWTQPGYEGPQTAAAQRGEKLYAGYCQSCHGIRGRGEPVTMGGDNKRRAPALDDVMHAWHHTDENLAQVIAEKPAPDSRMPAFGGVLSPEQIQDLIAYMKSHWGEQALRCQGPGHMDQNCLNGG
jgi:mono/diheme cytochrome c family protein